MNKEFNNHPDLGPIPEHDHGAREGFRRGQQIMIGGTDGELLVDQFRVVRGFLTHDGGFDYTPGGMKFLASGYLSVDAVRRKLRASGG